MDEFKQSSSLFENDIYEVLAPETAVARRNSAGGTGFEQIKIAIEKAKSCLEILMIEKYKIKPCCSNQHGFILYFELFVVSSLRTTKTSQRA